MYWHLPSQPKTAGPVNFAHVLQGRAIRSMQRRTPGGQAAWGNHVSLLGDSCLRVGLRCQRRQVPDLYGLVPTSRNQEPAVGAERQAGDEARVAAEAADQRPGVAVPDFHGTVFPRRGDPLALGVGAERRRPDVSAMSPEGLLLAGLDVPDLYRVLLTPRDQAPAVGAERQRHNPGVGVRAEGPARLLLLAQTGRVPEFHRSVAVRRSEVQAVAAKNKSSDPTLVVGVERADFLVGPRVPDLHSSSH